MQAWELSDARLVIGRDREQDVLARAWKSARTGRGRTVVLAGQAGIGKTRLTQAAVELVCRDDGLVLCGRAVSGQARAPFRPFAEGLCSAVRAVGLPDAAELVPFRRLLGRLIPQWGPFPTDADVSMVALGEAVLRFLRTMAGGHGCILVLEDLQWADPETLAVFEYVADNLADEPVLCVATVRDESCPALEVARGLAVRGGCQLLTVPPLPPTDVTMMAAVLLGTEHVPDDVSELVARADGIPLLVEAILLTAVSEDVLQRRGDGWRLDRPPRAVLPASFADSVRLRLATVGPQACRVVRAAAVLGVFDLDVLVATSELDDRPVADALAVSAGNGLLAVRGQPPAFEFRHALTRDAVLAALFPPERAALAGRGLDAVTALRPGLPADWCEIAAELAAQAGQAIRAAELFREIGRRALCSGALLSADATLSRARELADGDHAVIAAVEEDLIETLALAGDYPRAAALGATLLSRPTSGPDRCVRVHLRLARAAAIGERWPQAREHLESARMVSTAEHDCRFDVLDALVALGEDAPDRAQRLAVRAAATAEREGLPEVACEAFETLGRCRRPVDLQAAESAFDSERDIAERHGLVVWRLRALGELGAVDLLRTVDLRRLGQARELASALGAPAAHATIELNLCAGLMLRGDDAACADAAERAAALARRYGFRHTRAAALGFQAIVRARAGDGAGMERLLADAAVDAVDDASFPATAACARAMLAFVADDRHAALGHLAECRSSDTAQIRSQDPALGWWLLLRAVDTDFAAAAIAEIRREHDPVNVISRAFFSYADAIVNGRAGRSQVAANAVLTGDGLLADLPWLRHFGLRWVSEAALADGWGHPQEWLRRAEMFFADAGQPSLATACRSLLRRAGIPVRRRREADSTVPTDLRGVGVTAREFEVLGLLAEGKTNKVIAQRLYLSPRTVERHVANVCVKVGVQRRTELVALAARLVCAPAPTSPVTSRP